MNSFKKLLYRQIGMRNPMRFKFVPDELYLKIRYYSYFEREPNLQDPETFNEKLQWLKLYDRNPRYIELVDKYAVRDIVADLIGEEYLVKLLGVWERFEDIDFDRLPDKFVLKTTHDSGGVFICKNKQEMDYAEAKKKLTESLKRNYFYSGREWPYKEIKPRIICEEFIENEGHPPDDYKIMCFNGVPDNVMICTERDTGITKYYFFDMNWELMRCNGWGKKAKEGFTLPQPPKFDEMIKIAKVLSEDIPLARIDLYNVKGKIYFGEITLYPDSGFDNRLLPETDLSFGEKLVLRR